MAQFSVLKLSHCYPNHRFVWEIKGEYSDNPNVAKTHPGYMSDFTGRPNQGVYGRDFHSSDDVNNPRALIYAQEANLRCYSVTSTSEPYLSVVSSAHLT